MKFGIHRCCSMKRSLKRPPVLEKCKGMGFDAVEIIPFDPDGFPAKRVKQRARELGPCHQYRFRDSGGVQHDLTGIRRSGGGASISRRNWST